MPVPYVGLLGFFFVFSITMIMHPFYKKYFYLFLIMFISTLCYCLRDENTHALKYIMIFGTIFLLSEAGSARKSLVQDLYIYVALCAALLYSGLIVYLPVRAVGNSAFSDFVLPSIAYPIILFCITSPSSVSTKLTISTFSVFMDQRRWIYLITLVSIFFRRLVEGREFLVGALISLAFPIFSFAFTYYFDDQTSLMARVRSTNVVIDTMDFTNVWFGVEVVDQLKAESYGAFFWPGDIKWIGTIFEFGLVGLVQQYFACFYFAKYRCTNNGAKFLLGLSAFDSVGISLFGALIAKLSTRR